MQQNKKSLVVKIILILTLAVLLAGTAWSIWVFAHSSQKIELKEGQDFGFKNYVIRIDKVTEMLCTQAAGFVCKDWDKEQGVQFQIRSSKTNAVNYGYVGMRSGRVLATQGLTVELLGVDMGKKTVNLKITAE